jgi:tetratricopeptide (TPR) repeat protein
MRGAGILAASALLVVTLGAGAPTQGQEADAAAPSIGELQKAVERDPHDARALVALGLAYWRGGEFPRALEVFRRAVEVGPLSAEAHNWLGVALSEKSDLPGAVAAFRRAIELDPKYGRAYTNLGSALATGGDYAEAVDVFRQALRLEPNNQGAHFNLGMALRGQGDLEAALPHLRKVVEEDPANVLFRYELGQTLRLLGDLPGAIAAFEKVIELDPEKREGYYALGVALRQQGAAARRASAAGAPEAGGPADDAYRRALSAVERGALDPARDALTEVLRLDEGHADAHRLLGFVLGQQKDLRGALTHLERAVALRPESADAHYSLGVALWYSGSRDQALAELRKSLLLDPAAGDAHAFLGAALRETGDLAGARASLQRAIALLPPTAALYVDLGLTYLRAGDLDKALGQLEAGLNLPPPWVPAPDWAAAAAALRQAIGANPDRAEAQNVLGLVLGRQGASGREVAAAFREAVRLRPDFAEAHNNLGLVLVQSGDDPAGVAAFREAVRLQPDYSDAHANLGAALVPTDAEDAVRELEKAVALAPTSVKARFNLAAAYGASPKGGPAKEIEQLQKVIELDPAFARARVALGKAFLREGKVAEAVKELQEAARLSPESGEARYQLGLALARAGRPEEASSELKKGRDLAAADDRNKAAGLDVLEGRAALEKGDLEGAAAKLRHAIQLRPDFAEAQGLLEQVRRKQAAAAPLADDPGRVVEFERYIREARYAEVEPLLAAYVAERPQSAWGWYALGYAYFAQQKLGEAIKTLARSLELDVKNAEAHKILGRTLMIIGRFDAAQLEFEEGIRLKPESAELHYNLGKLASVQDNWQPARKALEEAVRLDPNYLEALDALGFALEALGDDAGAVARYEHAVALNRERQGRFVSAHVSLSAHYNRTGDPDKALAYARQALELDPRCDPAWFQQAKAEERLGRLGEAVVSLNQAIALNPRTSAPYYLLASLYRRLGKMDESQRALESFKRLQSEANELEKARREQRRNTAAPSGGA